MPEKLNSKLRELNGRRSPACDASPETADGPLFTRKRPSARKTFTGDRQNALPGRVSRRAGGHGFDEPNSVARSPHLRACEQQGGLENFVVDTVTARLQEPGGGDLSVAEGQCHPRRPTGSDGPFRLRSR